MRETSALSKGKRKKKKRTAKHSPLLTRGLQVDGCSRVHGDDLKKNPPTPPLAKKQLNTFLEPPWRLRAGGYSRVCHAQISTWSRGSRVFFRQVKRARAAHHRSFNRTEVSSPASQRSRYFHHHFNLPPPVQPPPLAISTSTFPSLTPPTLSLSLSRCVSLCLFLLFSRGVGKRRELAILFTLEVIPLYCVSIGFNPVGRPRSIRYSRLSSLQLPFITVFFFLRNFFIANLRSNRRDRSILHLIFTG